MKKTVIIKKNYEFKSILSKGFCYKGKLINIFIKVNNKSINKLGIAVSKKAGKSVKRNKIKRLIRENYRLLEEEMKTGYSIIILWKKLSDFEDFDFYSIREEIKELLVKSKVL